MYPQPPRPNLNSNPQMTFHLFVEVWIRGEEFLNACLAIPFLLCLNAFWSVKEAVVRKKATSVAGGKDDFVSAVVAAPEFDSAVLGVVDETEFDSLGGVDVCVETT